MRLHEATSAWPMYINHVIRLCGYMDVARGGSTKRLELRVWH